MTSFAPCTQILNPASLPRAALVNDNAAVAVAALAIMSVQGVVRHSWNSDRQNVVDTELRQRGGA
jgi:hypothetical protein